MTRCIACEGLGVITDEPGPRLFCAIFAVSERYVVHITAPRQKGGYVEIQPCWSPRLPGKRGRSKLTIQEQRAYETGRNAALAALMDSMGGGDFSVVNATQAH
jgi:hypothetical protein